MDRHTHSRSHWPAVVWHRLARVSFVRMLQATSPLWKVALAAGVAWQAALPIGGGHPVFAPLAAILCLQVTVSESVSRGTQRVLGIVAGVVVADLAAHWLGVNAVSVALLVLVGSGLATWLRWGKQAVTQVSVTAVLVLSVGGQGDYAFDRVVDTLIGAATAVLVNLLVFPPDYTPAAEQSLRTAGCDLAARVASMAAWLREGGATAAGRELQDDLDVYVETLHDASAGIRRALDSLRYSPLVRRRHAQMQYLSDRLLWLREAYENAAGMLRTLIEWAGVGSMDDRDRAHFAGRLDGVAAFLRQWAEASEAQAAAPAAADDSTPAGAHSPPGATGRDDQALRHLYQAAVENELRQLETGLHAAHAAAPAHGNVRRNAAKSRLQRDGSEEPPV